jgi:hypothetical protein
LKGTAHATGGMISFTMLAIKLQLSARTAEQLLSRPGPVDHVNTVQAALEPTDDPEMHPSQEVRAILDPFEGEISVYEKETEKGLQKFLKIKRMSNQKYSEDELPMRRETPE